MDVPEEYDDYDTQVDDLMGQACPPLTRRQLKLQPAWHGGCQPSSLCLSYLASAAASGLTYACLAGFRAPLSLTCSFFVAVGLQCSELHGAVSRRSSMMPDVVKLKGSRLVSFHEFMKVPQLVLNVISREPCWMYSRVLSLP